MNFLLLGLGPIGKRHTSILRAMGHDVTTVDPDKSMEADFLNWRQSGIQWDGILDCTPPNVRAAWRVRDLCKAHFVEKPLGTALYRHEPPPIMMGFNYHWDQSLREFVQIVKGANIHRLEITGGQYLQDWHAEDYQEIKHRYRGVVTDSMPHSIYIAHWILDGFLMFGGCTKGNTSHFDIDVDDFACVLLRCRRAACYLYADYLMQPRRFSIDAYAVRRHYHWEFCAADVDAMYQRQMEAFVKLCAGEIREGSYPDLRDGIAVQRVLNAIA
jgi:predicted dehydrogenase